MNSGGHFYLAPGPRICHSAQALTGPTLLARIPVAQQQRHQHGRIHPRAQRVALLRRQNDELTGAKPPNAAGHPHLHVSFEAVDRALVVDVMIWLVTAPGQHEMQQLEAVRLQQTGAARLVQGKAERTDADHIERLGMRQGHDDRFAVPPVEERLAMKTPPTVDARTLTILKSALIGH